MKRVIRCNNCTECGMLTPVGFNSIPRYWCVSLTQFVDPDDGCTFGNEGQPRVARDDIDVTLEDWAAVHGDDSN